MRPLGYGNISSTYAFGLSECSGVANSARVSHSCCQRFSDSLALYRAIARSSAVADAGQAQLASPRQDGIFQLVRSVGAGHGIGPSTALAYLTEHHDLERIGAQGAVHDVDGDLQALIRCRRRDV